MGSILGHGAHRVERTLAIGRRRWGRCLVLRTRAAAASQVARGIGLLPVAYTQIRALAITEAGRNCSLVLAVRALGVLRWLLLV